MKQTGWCYYDKCFKPVVKDVKSNIIITDPFESLLKLIYFNDPTNQVPNVDRAINYEACFESEYRFPKFSFKLFEYKNFIGSVAYADVPISKGTIVSMINEGRVVRLNKEEIKEIRNSSEYYIPIFKVLSEQFPWVIKFNNLQGAQKTILRKEMCAFNLDHLETNVLIRRVPGNNHRVTLLYQAIKQINQYELLVAEDEDRKTIGY